MIQRFTTLDGYINNSNDNKEYILYEDHLKEIEKVDNSSLYKEIKEDLKYTKNIIESLKLKWIDGPPTTTGWHWFKFKTVIGDINSIYEVKELRKTSYLTKNNCVRHFENIISHCPIQEPK